MCKSLISSPISLDNLVYVGIRDVDSPEQHLIAKNKILSATEINNDPINTAFSILNFLKTDLIYLSFDIDALDIFFGTGTPVEGGILPEQAISFIKTLVLDPRICLFELCEINPLLDSNNQMGLFSANLIKSIFQTRFSYLFNN